MDRKRDYYEDVEPLKTRAQRLWFAALLGALTAYPFLLPNYWVYLANYTAIHVLVAVGLNLLVGYTGQISLGHAGFFAAGAYGTTLLMAKGGLPFALALPLAAALAALLGAALAVPALRLEGPYLSIATLAFGLTVTQVIGRVGWFGGRQGLHTPELWLGPWKVATDRDFYLLLVPLTVALVFAARGITRTRVGRAFVAIRDSDVAAETLGVNLVRFKTLAFALSAFYTGLAGGLYAFVLRFIEPEMFGLMMSILFLAMVVVGGLGALPGSVAGACLLSWLDLELRNILAVPYLGAWLEGLSKTWFSITGVSNISFIVYGSILVAIMLFEPLGLYGIWLRTKRYWRAWPF